MKTTKIGWAWNWKRLKRERDTGCVCACVPLAAEQKLLHTLRLSTKNTWAQLSRSPTATIMTLCDVVAERAFPFPFPLPFPLSHTNNIWIKREKDFEILLICSHSLCFSLILYGLQSIILIIFIKLLRSLVLSFTNIKFNVAFKLVL